MSDRLVDYTTYILFQPCILLMGVPPLGSTIRIEYGKLASKRTVIRPNNHQWEIAYRWFAVDFFAIAACRAFTCSSAMLSYCSKHKFQLKFKAYFFDNADDHNTSATWDRCRKCSVWVAVLRAWMWEHFTNHSHSTMNSTASSAEFIFWLEKWLTQ